MGFFPFLIMHRDGIANANSALKAEKNENQCDRQTSKWGKTQADNGYRHR